MSLNYAKNHSDSSFVEFATAAVNAEGYLKNDQCMVDLRSFAETAKTTRGLANDKNLAVASDALVAAINDAVVYNEVRANALKRGGGLSTFYPYIPNVISTYNGVETAPQAQKEFYNFLGSLIPKTNSNYSASVITS